MPSTYETSPASSQPEGTEVLSHFVPTPERVSQYLELDHEQVLASLESAEGRKQLYESLMEHEQDLREIDPSFNPERLRSDLDLIAETLKLNEHYLEELEKPENRGIVGKTWDRVKSFAKKHPVATALIVVALVAGTVGGVLYMSGALEATQAGVAVEAIKTFFDGTKILNPPMGELPDFNPAGGVPSGK